MRVSLISATPRAEEHIEFCGRISHGTTDSIGNSNFIELILKMGHESVLEHASASFLIKDISRVCSHQLVRHRLSSVTQESQRYVRAPEVTGELDIPSVNRVIQDNPSISSYLELSRKIYEGLLKKGVHKEDARYFLPQLTPTTLVITANFRQWRNTLKLRLHKSSQEEIREVAKRILDQLVEIAPSVFSDLMEI